ncbi:S8 family serine peptidase [Rhizohabitans arisaemae]|uniref:S8 family serine peptidase n=1 Tax=Rhizohabitans arisaemae TaxID=2720610 RepID=UPI0024B1AB4C|nr:S8 family serine peptidase [Rhizohabitans arisaemae]
MLNRPVRLALASLAACLPTLLAGAAHADEVRDAQQWVLHSINVAEAWRVTRGAGATVAVIDSGVNPQLAELAGRVEAGPELIPREERTAGPGLHGTAMASLIAGAGKGGERGLLGVAPEARILSIRMMDDDHEGRLRDTSRSARNNPLARAIRYAANNGVKVINLSVGAYGPQQAERREIRDALARGIVIVAAVGNDGDTGDARRSSSSFWRFPAGYSGVIGVGAVDRDDRAAAFSNDNLSVAVAAPGVDVPVALPDGRYAAVRGSSAASALVAGIAALIKAKYPDMAPELVAMAITSTTRAKPERGYDDEVGFGIVDAGAALAKAATLAGYKKTVPVAQDRHFGAAPPPGPPARPGADPLKMTIYSGGALAGLAGVIGGLLLLTRRRTTGGPAANGDPR